MVKNCTLTAEGMYSVTKNRLSWGSMLLGKVMSCFVGYHFGRWVFGRREFGR